MQIMTSAAFQPAMTLPRGTPVAAVDGEGRPVAFGAIVSADPAQRSTELARFTASLVDNSKTVGDVANLVSASLDGVAEQLPRFEHPLGQGVAVIGLFSTGLALSQEISEGDRVGMVIAGFKFGSAAVGTIDEFCPGLPYVKEAATLLKIGTAGVSVYERVQTKPAPF